MVDPGKYIYLVSVQRKDETNEDGNLRTTWTEIAEDWADIQALSGREYFTARQHYSEVTHLIKLRYHSALADLDAKYRIVYAHESKTYDLLSVQNVSVQEREFHIYAVERNQ